MKHTFLIDASLFKDASNCMRKTRNILVLHKQDKQKHFKMEYGTAGHKFLAAWQGQELEMNEAIGLAIAHYSNKDIQRTIPEKDFRTATHLFNTCLEYTLKYPLGQDKFTLLTDKQGKALTEVRFAIPYRIDTETDSEFILTGTIDALGTMESELCFADRKFTASWNYKEYLDNYVLSPQLKFYRMILDKVSRIYPETFGQFSNLPCFIDGIFISKEGRTFERSPELIRFSQAELYELECQINDYIDSIIENLKSNIWPRNTTQCEASIFGACKFINACKKGALYGKETEEEVLEADFEKREYNPMEHGE